RAKNLRQTAYQILVASSAEKLASDEGDVWDSGNVRSTATAQVVYGGPVPEAGRKYFWKVRLWDQKGVRSRWSGVAHWSVGPLCEADWSGAKWIGIDRGPAGAGESPFIGSNWIWYGGDENPQSAPIGTRVFRRIVEIDDVASLAKATMILAVDNGFVLSVNGRYLGTSGDYHSPGTFDLLPDLVRGKNLIGVEASNVGENPNPAGVLAVITLVRTDGTETKITTDAGWLGYAETVDGWNTNVDLDTSDWKPSVIVAKFGDSPWGKDIGIPNAPRLPARILRKTFSVADQEIRRAMVYHCGLGNGYTFINGSPAESDDGGMGSVLGPALSEYDKRVFYQTADVTKFVRSGEENVFAFLIGNGRWFSPRQPGATTFGLPQAIGLLVIEYADGTVEKIVTDETWKATDDGPIVANNEYDGEEYDARKGSLDEMIGLSYDDSSWASVDRMPAPKGALRAQSIEPLRIVDFLEPVGETEVDGARIIDFGQNFVGWCGINVRGDAGAQVIMRFAESLNDDGSIYLANIRTAKVTDVYTLNGDAASESWTPLLVYHGFRFVELRTIGNVKVQSITGMAVSDDVSRVPSFECSNELLNQIHRNIYWGVLGNYRSIPTDCPQRDERQGWLGDRAASSRGEMYLFDVAAFYSKWVTDIRDAQRDDGALSDVCPSYWPLYSENITWPSAFTFIPESLYRQYGDTRVLAENYDAMARWMTHMEKFVKDGITEQDTYGDWCMPPEDPKLIHSADPARKTSKGVLATSYSIRNYRLLAQYAEILGKGDEEISKWTKKADEMSAAYLEKYYRADTGLFDNGTQTASVLSLAYGIVPESEQAKAFDALVRRIELDSDYHIGTGLIGAQQLMRTLSDRGRVDLAYRIATQRDFPSWGFMIDHGATTIWELWNGNTADPAMNSQNHVMLVGDLNIWFYEYLAGIRPEAPGFAKIGIRPYPVGDLTWAKAEYPSIRGTIGSSWKTENGTFTLDVAIPANTTANVYIPITDESVVDAIQANGKGAKTAPGVRFTGVEGDRAVFAIGSGVYQFTAPTE
ncbi:MAG: family 78 glycoside hydrolase catalytic domain, partial [Planctomycetia bacterium]|nr:family 78 glycoside hydrolase catalytic domain [Planctomycetia bacterium]